MPLFNYTKPRYIVLNSSLYLCQSHLTMPDTTLTYKLLYTGLVDRKTYESL